MSTTRASADRGGHCGLQPISAKPTLTHSHLRGLRSRTSANSRLVRIQAEPWFFALSIRSALRIDHVILAATDPDAAAARLEAEYGLRAAGGGRHEGLGTHNRIVPLGGGYLEILGVADPDEAARSQVGRALAGRIAQVGEGLMGWAVAVDDVVPVAERLGTPVSAIVRQGLSARLTGVLEAMATPFLPFFLARDPGIEDPGASGGTGGIEWIEVAGDPDRLDAWLDGERLRVRVVDGAPGVRAVAIGGRILR